MMDFLECKICNIPYDEQERRPRHAPCGHEWCSACISELIEDSIFLCPKCRQKNKVEVPDDLPVSFGLIDVIRAFKTQNISLPQKTEPITSGALNVDVCKVHHKTFGHRCRKCQRWLCDSCLKSHTEITGCSTISSSIAMKIMKEEQSVSIDELLSSFKEGSNGLLSKIQEHNDKIEENTKKIKDLKEQSEMHEKEIQKIQHLLEQGKLQTKDILKYQKHLNVADSPHAVMEGIEVLEEVKQELRSWSLTNLGAAFPHDNILYYISKALKEYKDVYFEMEVNNQRRYGQISQHEDNLYFHTFRAQTVTHTDICRPFAHLQKLIPPSPSLVFMELSLKNIVKGHVHLRLPEDLPNIREHMVQLVTGQQGHTLAGIKLDRKDDYSIKNTNLPFKKMKVTADINARKDIKCGDVVGCYTNGYLKVIYFHIDSLDSDDDRVIGCIESGMDIIQECFDNHSQGVVITDCGLVLEQKYGLFTN